MHSKAITIPSVFCVEPVVRLRNECKHLADMASLEPPNFFWRYLGGCALLIVTIILPGILLARKKKSAYRRVGSTPAV